MADINFFTIGEDEKLCLDGIELRRVTKYKLCHSGGETAELTVTLGVKVNQVDLELKKV